MQQDFLKAKRVFKLWALAEARQPLPHYSQSPKTCSVPHQWGTSN